MFYINKISLIYILILIIILILIHLYFFKTTETFRSAFVDTSQIEETRSTSSPRIFENPENYILDKYELIDILINDYDNYYTTFNETDLKVRNVNSIEEYKYKIKNSPVTISDEEKNIIINTIYKIKKIFNNYDNIGFTGKKANIMNIYIGIIDGTNYEEGFPHTRENKFIIIPKYLINKHNLITVLIHEMVHIYQKVYPEDIQFYLDTYNFKKYSYRNNAKLGASKELLIKAELSGETETTVGSIDLRSMWDESKFLKNSDSFPQERGIEKLCFSIHGTTGGRSLTECSELRANPDIDNYIYSNSNNELLYCTYNDNATSIMNVTYYPINNEANEHPFEMMAYSIESNIQNELLSNSY